MIIGKGCDTIRKTARRGLGATRLVISQVQNNRCSVPVTETETEFGEVVLDLLFFGLGLQDRGHKS